MDEKDYCDQLRMGRDTFHNLVRMLREIGRLKETAYISLNEQAVKFLYILGHNANNRIVRLFLPFW